MTQSADKDFDDRRLAEMTAESLSVNWQLRHTLTHHQGDLIVRALRAFAAVPECGALTSGASTWKRDAIEWAEATIENGYCAIISKETAEAVAQTIMALNSSLEWECQQGDKICAAARVERTEGGSLNPGKIINALREQGKEAVSGCGTLSNNDWHEVQAAAHSQARRIEQLERELAAVRSATRTITLPMLGSLRYLFEEWAAVPHDLKDKIRAVQPTFEQTLDGVHEEAMEATIVPSTSGTWISSKDKTPSEFVAGARYLCWFQDQYCVLEWEQGCGWLWGDGSAMQMSEQEQVTHWMQLPAIPSATGRTNGI